MRRRLHPVDEFHVHIGGFARVLEIIKALQVNDNIQIYRWVIESA